MKTVILHGLGQTSKDWKEVMGQISSAIIECPELFSLGDTKITYSQLLDNLERQYADSVEPLFLCGLSLGAILALDYAIRHRDKVAALVLVGAQYKIPRLLMGFQNLIFHFMPQKVFREVGLSKDNMINLTRSMRSLDFTQQLREIICPVTILCGECDKANINASKTLEQLLPNAELFIIPNAGHELNKDAPVVLADILQQKQNKLFYRADNQKGFSSITYSN